MNTPRIALALAAASAIATTPTLTSAAVPPVDSIGKPALIRCGTTNGVVIRASHADKIVFQILGFLQAQLPNDQPALDLLPRNEGLDIKVLDDPKTVADLLGKVLTFLGAADIPVNRQNIRIMEVKYAMVCPTTAAP
jgi:hypothetical protein